MIDSKNLSMKFENEAKENLNESFIEIDKNKISEKTNKIKEEIEKISLENKQSQLKDLIEEYENSLLEKVKIRKNLAKTQLTMQSMKSAIMNKIIEIKELGIDLDENIEKNKVYLKEIELLEEKVSK